MDTALKISASVVRFMDGPPWYRVKPRGKVAHKSGLFGQPAINGEEGLVPEVSSLSRRVAALTAAAFEGYNFTYRSIRNFAFQLRRSRRLAICDINMVERALTTVKE